MLTTNVLILGIVAFVILLVILAFTMYVKAPPSYAYLLSGFRKEPRVLIGTGGFKIPILERQDKVFLGQVSVDVKTSIPVPTHDYIDVMVDAVCKVRALPDSDGTRLAAKNFLNMEAPEIAAEITDSLEGNMREVIGAITLQNLITDRDKFSDEIQAKAAKDMAKLGLEVISCNIQNITDQNHLIENLGADNTYAIRKNAAITKANAERDISVAESQAKKAANDVRVQTETEIAERNNELEIKKADLKRVSDTKKAEADAAYEIQKQEQQKTINAKTVEAQIEQTRQEQTLSAERIKIKENELTAEINATANAEKYQLQVESDAKKYQTEISAQAALEQKRREAEARLYAAQQEAEAIKTKAEADKFAAQQEAEGIKARGLAQADATKANLEAEAAGILAKGKAEAEAMQKKAEAYERYGSVAVVDMLTRMNETIMPEIARAIAEPLGKIGEIKIYGTSGQEASGLSANIPAVIKQTFDVMRDVSGVDLSEVMKSSTISAKTDRNINISGENADQDTAVVVK